MQNNKNNMADEEPRYKKKSRYADKSKTSVKSDHKHIYEECLLKTPDGNYYKSKRCGICGKIGETHFFEVIPIKGTRTSALVDPKKLKNIYPNLPVYEINNIWDKYAM